MKCVICHKEIGKEPALPVVTPIPRVGLDARHVHVRCYEAHRDARTTKKPERR